MSHKNIFGEWQFWTKYLLLEGFVISFFYFVGMQDYFSNPLRIIMFYFVLLFSDLLAHGILQFFGWK